MNQSPKAKLANKKLAKKPKKTSTKLIGKAIVKARTPTDTIHALAKALPKNVMARGDPYSECRLNPFHNGSSGGIPDGSNTNYITIDHMVFDDILCDTAAGFLILTLPQLPTTAMIQGRGITGAKDITVNGNLFTNNSGVAMYPLGTPTPYKTYQFPPGVSVNDPYTSAKARVVGIAYRLLYTGQASTCSGTVTVSPSAVGYKEGGIVQNGTTSVIPSAYGVNQYDSTQTLILPTLVNTPVINLDFQFVNNTYSKASIISRPEQGVQLLTQHSSLDYKVKPTQDQPFVPVCNTTTSVSSTGNLGTMMFTSPTPTAAQPPQGIIWYDDDWTGYQVEVSGIAIGATFRWETAICIEYNPMSASPYFAVTTTRSPNRPGVVQKTQTLVSQSAVTVPH